MSELSKSHGRSFVRKASTKKMDPRSSPGGDGEEMAPPDLLSAVAIFGSVGSGIEDEGAGEPAFIA
jgi:hypothetical protein